MFAFRQIHEVKAGAVTIDLPADFHAKRVEIIVLPIPDSVKEEQSLQNLLMEAPTLVDEELVEFQKVRDLMSQWNAKEF